MKLYALLSLYRQRNFDRVSVYRADVATLLKRQGVVAEVLLERLGPHVLASDLKALRATVRDIEARIQRCERLPESARGQAHS